VRMRPVELNHNMFPACILAPSFNLSDIADVSRLEVVYGLQKYMNWLVNSRVANVRKALNDMFIVDPSLINYHDLLNPEPGKLLRLRRRRWGRGVQGAVEQLRVADVTGGNMMEASLVADMAQKVTGVGDSMMGMMRTSGERVSAREAQFSRTSEMARAQKDLMIAANMSLYDMTHMMAHNTQQLMSQGTYIKIAGQFEEQLRREYNISEGQNSLYITPADIAIDFDVVPTPLRKGEEFLDTWVQLFQSLVKAPPEVSMNFDIVRIFKHVARLMGADEISAFERNANVQVRPDEEVAQQRQAGNMVPVGEYQNAMAQPTL